MIIVGPEWAEHNSRVVLVIDGDTQDEDLIWSEVGFKTVWKGMCARVVRHRR